MPTRREVLQMIADDAESDAHNFEGRPFDGKTVGEYFGHHGASIQALAKIMITLLPEED